MTPHASGPRRILGALALLGLTVAALAMPLRAVVADVVTTGAYIVTVDDVVNEDVYVAAASGSVEGVIEGDLSMVTGGDLVISGRVTGSVLVIATGGITVSGTVEGSLRGAAREVAIEGTVEGDIAVAAVSTRISGTVGRDALSFAGSFGLDGDVGRDIKGRFVGGTIDGTVGHDVDIAVGDLEVGRSATVEGDIRYRSGNDATVAPTAQIGGQFSRLPTRGSFFVELILTVATILSFFAFLLGGIVLLWLFRSTAPRAVGAVLQRPWRSALVGTAAVVLIPVAVALFAISLVGIPLAVALVLLIVLGLLFGPVPAVTALGLRVLRGRGGIYGGFLVGGVAWRIGIWLIPLVGLALYLGGLVLGVGGWLLGAWEQRMARAARRGERGGGPKAREVPEGWEPPLAPATAAREPEVDGDDNPPAAGAP
ncbi:MAG: hypothetical protein PVI35_04440 [Acidimicrobiia bacterium]|jgi:hypothetical protein